MRREIFAAAVVLLVIAGFPATMFAYQASQLSAPGVRVITLTGNSPAVGGWQPDTIRVNLGERVRLRITSNDVVHGLAVPALGINVDEIQPGHVETVEFVASRVGRFPFACTRWCSADHWRMRGAIEVVDPANPGSPVATPAPAPEYQRLGLDIDVPHPAANVPSQAPSAERAAALKIVLPAYLTDLGTLRTHSPSDLFAEARADAALQDFNDSQVWDLLAYAWQQEYGAEAIRLGQSIYSRDCAACHGETGKGDGPAGARLPGLSAMHPDMKKGPASFSDASQMLGATDSLLQGKILRGGMGTGMPEWGSLHDEQELRDLVAYLRSFVWGYQK